MFETEEETERLSVEDSVVVVDSDNDKDGLRVSDVVIDSVSVSGRD